MDATRLRVGFVSTRLAGTDGVSLETVKWSDTLTRLGHECFYFAGESDWPADRTHCVPEAHFEHPDIQAIHKDLFGDCVRSAQTSQKIQALKDHLKTHLHHFCRAFRLDLLIAQNALSLPMNVPLALALTEVIAETEIPTIAHHHDFWWERRRFAVGAADDYLRAAFPPTLRTVHHVVINSFGGRQLAHRAGVSSTLIPNVLDFGMRPQEPDAYAAELRPALGIGSGEYLLLQPTRIVPRKRIERAIELARRLDLKCTLLISHDAGDEGFAYRDYLRDFARIMDVPMLFASGRINHQRGLTPDGETIFSLADVYRQADLVTYPSDVEGFGNAFLETVYYRRPIVMSTYEIFQTDIRPKGFRVISFEDFVTEETVQEAREVLRDPVLAAEITEHNYELGRRYYSYHTLEHRLRGLMLRIFGVGY